MGDGEEIETSTISKGSIDEENGGYIRIKVWSDEKTMGEGGDAGSEIIEGEVSDALKKEVRFYFDFWWGM